MKAEKEKDDYPITEKSLPRLLILLEFGFHEVKKYIHSGLASKLERHFVLIFLALEKDRKAIENQFSDYGVVIFIEELELTIRSIREEGLARASCEAWMRNKGIPLFHNYKILPRKKKSDFILGRTLIKKILVYFSNKKAKQRYFNEYVRDILNQSGITHVLGVSISSQLSKVVFATASLLNIKTYYLVNSWKDLYVNPLVPFFELTKIFVWSTQMQSDYLRICPYLHQKRIFITGNPSLDPYIDYTPKFSRQYYAKKYGLSDNKIWLYYTMMPPGLWKTEMAHILLLGKKLHDMGLGIEMLIRRNPNHSKTEFEDLSLPANCTLTQHYITYNKDTDLIIQTDSGEQEWMDLVYHTDANISIPSTVTLEFLSLRKPVVNLYFSAEGELPSELRSHFESGFYKPLVENDKLVIKSNSFENFVEVLKGLPIEKERMKSVNASDKVLHNIL